MRSLLTLAPFVRAWPFSSNRSRDDDASTMTARRNSTSTVFNVTPLHGAWSGWRLAGRGLVSPECDQISGERLRGILFTENNRLRLQRQRARAAAQIAPLPARERFAGRA